MNVIILQPALDDFLAVGAYFDGVSERLAARFRRCVEKTIEAILDFPKLSAAIRKGYRLRPIVRFRKYGILYRIQQGIIFVHGVCYLGRGPQFWRTRLR